jgi:predicted CXXCH cytochrome family protein
MRVRTAKQRAQRIDLYYFKHARGLQRWRRLLSLAVPLIALAWVSVVVFAGGRKAYSAGPVSTAHAFAEMKCEVCHSSENATAGFRAHTTGKTCLTCHDAPAHAPNMTPAPACSTCHREHQGRVQIARTSDGFCASCHADLKTTNGDPTVARAVSAFPQGHPEFAAVKTGARDPGGLRFNHAVHLKDGVRGPAGPEKLECAACHKPEIARAAAGARAAARTGLMTPATFQETCARCHPLFFDERIEQAVPHAKPDAVRAFVQQTLTRYIQEHPDEIGKPDSAFRRVPLNFPRPPEPPARNAEEWVARRSAADERILWNKTCAECHDRSGATAEALPVYAPSNVTRQWMPRAAFDHGPHLMVTCRSCHAAEGSSKTTDVLMPNQATCASCHSPSKGAESRCFECHRYHDWTKARPVTPAYSLTDFK